MEKTDTGLGAGLGVLMFVAGAMIGAGLALLYAPKTGRELREKVTGMTGDAVTKIKEMGAGAQEKIKSSFGKGKESAAEYAGRGEAGKEPMFH